MAKKNGSNAFISRLRDAFVAGHQAEIDAILKEPEAAKQIDRHRDLLVFDFFSALGDQKASIQSRCRALALALLAAGEYRLQAMAWECAPFPWHGPGQRPQSLA